MSLLKAQSLSQARAVAIYHHDEMDPVSLFFADHVNVGLQDPPKAHLKNLLSGDLYWHSLQKRYQHPEAPFPELRGGNNVSFCPKAEDFNFVYKMLQITLVW